VVWAEYRLTKPLLWKLHISRASLSFFHFWLCGALLLVLAGLAGFPGLAHAAANGFGTVSSNTTGDSDETSLTMNSTNSSSYDDGVSGGSASGATSYVTADYYEYMVATGAVGGGAVPIRSEGPGGGLLNTYIQAAATATQGKRT
jgi:hypothetical protein